MIECKRFTQIFWSSVKETYIGVLWHISEINTLARELAFLVMWLSPDFVPKLSNVERGQRFEGWTADTLQYQCSIFVIVLWIHVSGMHLSLIYFRILEIWRGKKPQKLWLHRPKPYHRRKNIGRAYVDKFGLLRGASGIEGTPKTVNTPISSKKHYSTPAKTRPPKRRK